MSLKNWFKTAEPEEPAQQEQRADARLSVHTRVVVCGDPTASEGEPEAADLVDFASGGLRLRASIPVEIGQTLWIRTRVTHVSQHGPSAEIGVTWDADRSAAPTLPTPGSGDSSAAET